MILQRSIWKTAADETSLGRKQTRVPFAARRYLPSCLGLRLSVFARSDGQTLTQRRRGAIDLGQRAASKEGLSRQVNAYRRDASQSGVRRNDSGAREPHSHYGLTVPIRDP
jgi:hypothetical protein